MLLCLVQPLPTLYRASASMIKKVISDLIWHNCIRPALTTRFRKAFGTKIVSQPICQTSNDADNGSRASVFSLPDHPPSENRQPRNGAIGKTGGKARKHSRLFGLARPATKQIFARPADPLSVALSYEILRNGIGVLGLVFPIVMLVGGGLYEVQNSLSAYYHFSRIEPAQYGAGTMRDAFVGILCAIGAFLFFYRGHSLQEDLALNGAGISAVLVALMPMDWPVTVNSTTSVAGTIHWVSATVFFTMIGYVCIFRARDTLLLMRNGRRRRAFKRTYFALGSLMLATPAAVAVSLRQSGYATLLVEIGGIIVFSSFWLIKGYEIRSSLRRTLP